MLRISKKAQRRSFQGRLRESEVKVWEGGVSDHCSIPPTIDLGDKIGEVEVKNMQPEPSAAKSANLRLVLPLLMENKCRIVL